MERVPDVAVLGLGYVGLPTACMLALNGLHVVGVDVDERIIDRIRDGGTVSSEADVNTLVGLAFQSGRLALSTLPQPCGAYIVAVPTPIDDDHRPDLSHVEEAVTSIAEVALHGSLIVIESTIPPGTVRDVVVPILRGKGLDVGRDVLVAHCPERVLPGATMVELVNNDRIIGGYNHDSTAKAVQLYASFVRGRIHLTDVTTAEMVKVMENTYRDVNVALANEFARVADVVGVNIWDAIRLANNHPRVNILRPGPGVGGHCIPVDPWFLVSAAPAETPLIAAARQVNDSMPAYVVDRLLRMAHVREGHVAVLGLAYRGGLGDTRGSPAIEVVRRLLAQGIAVKAHDPLVDDTSLGFKNVGLDEAVAGASAILVLTDHREFVDADPVAMAFRVASRVVFDARGCLPSEAWARAGFTVLNISESQYAQ